MSAAQQQPIAVIGAGSWGTAMAFQTARAGRETILWSHNPDHISEMEKDLSNEKYLPGIPFPDNLKVSADLQASIEQVRDILRIPSQIRVVALLPIGYPQDPTPTAKSRLATAIPRSPVAGSRATIE